jgi:hypothetical protein
LEDQLREKKGQEKRKTGRCAGENTPVHFSRLDNSNFFAKSFGEHTFPQLDIRESEIINVYEMDIPLLVECRVAGNYRDILGKKSSR